MPEQTIVSKPWWSSRIIIGAAVSVIAKVLVLTHVVDQFTDEDSQTLTDTVLLVVGGVADMFAIYSRVTQKQAPKITAGGTTQKLDN